MAEITASYRRVFQVRPYETETVELSVTDEVRNDDLPDWADPDHVRTHALALLAQNLHDALAEIGDAVVLKRMESAPEKPSGAQRVLNAMTGTPPPDPWAR